MKSLKILIGIAMMAVLLTAPMSSAQLPGDLTVTFDASHGAFHTSADYLEGNLTAAGSTFNYIDENSTYDFGQSDVVMMSGTDGNFSSSDLTMITDWFNQDGPRLLWVASDSDFGGFTNFTNLHAPLEAVESSLRFDSGSIEDPVNNDNAAYRVLATNPVSDGEVNSQLTEGVDQMIMHGPSGVLAVDENGDVVNPSDTEAMEEAGLDNIEVVMQSSADAVALDSDLSETKFDFYVQDGQSAPFSMIAIEDLGDGKWVIVSGEAVFSDYKFMYSGITENGGTQDGKTFVDNVLSWFSTNGGSDSIGGGFLPVNYIAVGAAFAVIGLMVRRRR